MNIASITSPGAVAPPLATASTHSGQSFAQQFGAGLLLPTAPAAPVPMGGAAVPVASPSLAATPIVVATDPPVPTALPSAPLTVLGVEAAALADAPTPQAPPREPQSVKLLPTDTRIPAAASDDAITASLARGVQPLHPVKAEPVKADPAKGGVASRMIDASVAGAPELPQITLEKRARDPHGSTDKEPALARDEAPLLAITPAETPPVPAGMNAAEVPAALDPVVAPVTPSPTAPAQTALAATSADATATTVSAGAAASAVVESAVTVPGTTIDPAGVARIAQPQPQTDGLQAPPIGAAAAAPAFAARLAEAYPAPPPAQPMPSVEARSGRIGHDIGIEIARRLSAGKEELTVRLNPADMGRVEIRMGFDESGHIRAVVAAESPVALELLRRDAGELARALADAGIRSDASSFRFDSRGGDAGQSGQRSPHGGRHHDGQPSPLADGEEAAPLYRPLRTSGRVDLLA